MVKKDAQKREHSHCIGFFRIAVFTSLDEWKWDHHGICSESALIKQEIDRPNSLATRFYRLF